MKLGSKPTSERGANGGTCPLPPGRIYVPHQGHAERTRRMRQSWRQIERLRDPASLAARERLLNAVEDDPDPEYAALHLGHTALLAALDCRASWADSVGRLLARFDENARSADEAEA